RALATFLLNRPVVGFVFSRGGLHVSSHASTRDAGIALVSSCSQTPFGNTGPRNSVSAKRHRRTAPSNDAGCRDSLAWSRLRPCRANGEVAARGGETEFRGRRSQTEFGNEENEEKRCRSEAHCLTRRVARE